MLSSNFYSIKTPVNIIVVKFYLILGTDTLVLSKSDKILIAGGYRILLSIYLYLSRIKGLESLILE